MEMFISVIMITLWTVYITTTLLYSVDSEDTTMNKITLELSGKDANQGENYNFSKTRPACLGLPS